MGGHRTSRRERGVVLLLVLWVFMTLGVLALDFSTTMRDDATSAMNLSDETRSYYVAVAGLQRALYENTLYRKKHPGGVVQPKIDQNGAHVGLDTGEDDEDDTPYKADGDWHRGTFGGASFAVLMTGEDGKIPLNINLDEDMGIYTELLHFIVSNLVRGGNQTTGVDKDTDEQINTIVDSILDWRDCDDEARLNGAETKYYSGLKRPYSAKNGFFDSTDELMRVKGVTPDVFFGHDDLPGLADIFSPFPRGEALVINAGQITPEVVRALVPTMSLTDAQDFVAGRKDDPAGTRLWLQQELNTTVPGLGDRVQIVEPKYIRVEARADVDQKRNQAGVIAIVELAGSEQDEPVIHSWLDRAPLRGAGPGEQPAQPAAEPGTGSS